MVRGGGGGDSFGRRPANSCSYVHLLARPVFALRYPNLIEVVPQLVRLLMDNEEKTRSNAAGALGNLVRNSSSLCNQLVDAGAPQALLRVALEVGGG